MSKNFDALRQVKLASRSYPRLGTIRHPSAQTAFIIRAKDCVDPLELEEKANEGLSRRGISRYLIWFSLGVLLVSANVIFLRHYARAMGDHRQALEVASVGNAIETVSPGSTIEKSSSVPPATLSWDLPGFVVQVAAMKQEENADALAETLHRRNFPAFVFRRGAGPFYRVVIGVYGDGDSAGRVKEQLERQGFKAILRRWLPE